MYNPIHSDDIIATIPALLEAASVPATVVNWGGDDPVSIEDWCTYLGELTGLEPKFEPTDQTIESVSVDLTRMHELVGPTTVPVARRVPQDGRGPPPGVAALRPAAGRGGPAWHPAGKTTSRNSPASAPAHSPPTQTSPNGRVARTADPTDPTEAESEAGQGRGRRDLRLVNDAGCPRLNGPPGRFELQPDGSTWLNENCGRQRATPSIAGPSIRDSRMNDV